MTRKTSRRFTNYSKPNDDSYHKEQMSQPQQQQRYQQEQQYQSDQRQQPMSDDNGEGGSDSVIADMAQGFIQAQAKISNNHSTVNNMEIALLLQKCNDQLEEIRRSTKGARDDQSVNNQSNRNSATQGLGQQQQCIGGEQGSSKQQGNQMPVQELQGLLASILQGNDNNQNNKTESSTKQGNRNNNNGNSSTNGGEDQKKGTQTVSQVLAQAQYELANELENSLKKLKQVIAESEKIASNISNLLGEETKTKS